MKTKLLALLLTLALLLLPARAEDFYDWLFTEETPSLPTSTPAPTPSVPRSRLRDDGMLRVWLRSLEDPSSLRLTLAGSYALESNAGFHFARDTVVILTAAEGAIWMTVGGLTVNMGPALTLTRCAVNEGELNGIVIAESGRPTLYCGDLSVVLTGGGGLRPTLTIQMEEYLLGVVAYEMSDSFPVEALKAQAVAARTYALQKKWNAGKRDYDLVDTTADQVYKGYDPELVNVAEAVRATRGMVCTYKGGLATCYYTASNGGQTALPSQIWGSGDADGCFAMADDPYDLENPYSLENELTFTAECEGSVKLKEMLEAALDDIMVEEGFDDWTFDAIASIEPADPRFEGSKCYDTLAFDVYVKVPESALKPSPSGAAEGLAKRSGAERSEADEVVTPSPSPDPDLPPAPEPLVRLPDPRRVTIKVFPDIKDGLSLGMNGADCELISVDTATDADGNTTFRLVMRRYGHGVGMSQRGAQCMAGDHGMDCLEILKFYYPGARIERVNWPEPKLPAVEDLPAAVGAERPEPTPTPTPAPLPKLKSGEHYATVNASSLNVRQRPTTNSAVVDVLEKGRKLIVSAKPDADGWVPVKTGDVEGYVKEEYLAG